MKYQREIHNLNSNMLGIIFACLYLFFAYLSASVFFPEILSRGTLLLFLVFGAMASIKRFFSGMFTLSHYSIWYGILISYTVVTFPFSSSLNSFNSNHFYQMIVCFVITLFMLLFLASEREFCWICWSYVLSAVVMIILLYRSGKLVGDYNQRLGNDVMGNANFFATSMMYSVMYAFWLLIYVKYSVPIKLVLYASIILIIYALMLSAGRKFFVIPFIYLFILLLMKNDDMHAKNVIKYTVLMALIVGLLYLIITKVSILYRAIGIRMEGLFNSLSKNGEVDTSLIVRAQMRSAAIKGWLQKPIFGNGFDTFQYYRSPELVNGRSHGYSHCNHTELLFNGGIVYWLLYYSIFAWVIWKVISNKSTSSKYRALAVAVVISQIILDYGGVFYDTITTQVFLMMAVKALENVEEENWPTQRFESRYIRG